jgi:GGDEF domain-containing protein
LPRFLSLRLKATDCPWAATTLTATAAIIFLIAGDPVWMIAAAHFTYLIGICMPNIAVWLLRRDLPNAERPYRAPRGTILLGVIAAVIWLFAAILGFQQFGLPTVVFGLALAYSGAALYGWRVVEDRLRAGLPAVAQTLHVKLTGAMVAVLVLDGIAYLLAVNTVAEGHHELVSVLADIFVVVALLTVSVGLVLPGMITYSAIEVSSAAKRLTRGTLHDFSNAMGALGRGDLEAAHASVNIVPVRVNSRDELGEMGHSFNILQEEVREAAVGLGEAREKLRAAREELLARHEYIAHLAHHDSLTGLPNRTSLTNYLDKAFDEATADGHGFALLTIDLDHFKEANDLFGHVIGDELLCAISSRLERAAEGAFIARVGGDEFTVVLTAKDLRGGRFRHGQAPPCRGRRSVRGSRAADPDRAQCRRRAIPAGRQGQGHSDRQCRCRALSRQGRRPSHDQVLRAGDGSPSARALRAPARSPLRHYAWRIRHALSAPSQDRRRGVRLRSAHSLEASEPRLSAAEQIHSPRRAERHDRGDRRMDAARGLRRGGVLAGAAASQRHLSPVQFRHGNLSGLVKSVLTETGLDPARARDHRRGGDQ